MTKESLIDLFDKFLLSDKVKKSGYYCFGKPVYQLIMMIKGEVVYTISLSSNDIGSGSELFSLSEDEFKTLHEKWQNRGTKYNYNEVLCNL